MTTTTPDFPYDDETLIALALELRALRERARARCAGDRPHFFPVFSDAQFEYTRALVELTRRNRLWLYFESARKAGVYN